MIVFISPRLGFFGGVERHVFDLARGLRELGHEVALAYGPLEGREPGAYSEGFAAVVPEAQAASLVRDARVVYAHKYHPERLLDQVPPHTRIAFAVHDHDSTCVRSHRYLPFTRTPCFRPPGLDCVSHGCVVVRDRSRTTRIRFADPFALRRTTRSLSERGLLITCSAFLRRTLLDAGIRPDRVAVIHPVPPEDAAPRLPVPTEKLAAFAGQTIRGKGADLLVRAAAASPELRVIIAGEGNDGPMLRRLSAELGVDKRVQFFGSLSASGVREIYDRARVVVVPSRWPEPFGMVGVEAMRRGRVVVAAWHGGIPEWLADGETGFGFRPGDAADLGVMIERAMAAGDNERMAEAARKRAQSGFRFEAMIQQVERVLGVAKG